jgi:hypothetical protein
MLYRESLLNVIASTAKNPAGKAVIPSERSDARDLLLTHSKEKDPSLRSG